MSRPHQVPHRRLAPRDPGAPGRSRWGFRLLLLIGLIALLPACSVNLFEKQIVRTAEPGEKTCLERCNLGKTQCQQRQQAREQACMADYSSDSENYRLCKSKGVGRRCRPPVTCLGADFSICERELRDCAVFCGARVERTWHPSVTPMLGTGVQTDTKTGPAPAGPGPK